MIPHGIACRIKGIGDFDDVYNFEHMIGVQDGFVFPVKIENGVAYFCESSGEWTEDDCFPWQAYNKWVNKKLEEELDL